MSSAWELDREKGLQNDQSPGHTFWTVSFLKVELCLIALSPLSYQPSVRTINTCCAQINEMNSRTYARRIVSYGNTLFIYLFLFGIYVFRAVLGSQYKRGRYRDFSYATWFCTFTASLFTNISHQCGTFVTIYGPIVEVGLWSELSHLKVWVRCTSTWLLFLCLASWWWLVNRSKSDYQGLDFLP